MNKKQIISYAAITAAAILNSQAVVSWTGATDNDLFEDSNWDFSGAVNGTALIDPDFFIFEDLTISNATVSGATAGFGYLGLGDGHFLTLDNTTLEITGTGGFQSLDDGAGSPRVNAPMTVNLTNGSSADIQFLNVGVDIVIDGTSSLNIRGGGDGLNSQTELSRILLSEGGQLTLTNRAEFDEQISANNGAGNILVNGIEVTAANIDTLFTFSGSTATATAVPEPSSTALLGLGGLALILRRRK